MDMNIFTKYSATALNSEQALWVEGENGGGKQLKNGNSSPLLYHQPQSASAHLLSPSESLLVGYSRPYFAFYLDVRQCA